MPSVTTVLGRYKDSGALIKWAYRQGIEHENLRSRGLPAPNDLYDVTAKAAEAGTIAHDMIEQHILGKFPIEVSVEVVAKVKEGCPDVQPDVWGRACNSYSQFVEWLASTKLEITHTELGLISEKHRFGGTLDAVGLDTKGRIVLIDWKTSNAVYADYLYQLAAYALLLEECRPELNPQGYHLLRVAKESADFTHHQWGELDAQKEGFLLMRKLYELDYITKKRVG